MSIQVSEKDCELLSQFVDGELNDMDARRLSQRLKSDPALRDTLDAMRAMDLSVQHVLRSRDSVPAAIAEQVGPNSPQPVGRADDNVLRFPGRAEEARTEQRQRWPLAVAASFVAALGVAFVLQQPQQPAGLPGNDALVSNTLDTAISGSGWIALDDGRALQPVLTFAHRDGAWCREYLLRSSDSDWRAVACRNDGRWETQAAGLESYLDATSDYRPAGAPESAPVSVFISENAADVALGRQGESQLIERNWR